MRPLLRLRPYLARHKRVLLLGLLTVVASNLFTVAQPLFVGRAIDSLKVLFAPFLPFTCEKLHAFFNYEKPLFGEQYTETVTDSLGEHIVLRYRNSEGQQWKASELPPGKKLNQPGPLFKKLDESVAEEERGRLGK